MLREDAGHLILISRVVEVESDRLRGFPLLDGHLTCPLHVDGQDWNVNSRVNALDQPRAFVSEMHLQESSVQRPHILGIIDRLVVSKDSSRIPI